MRHRYRSALLDLFLKQRNNRTVRAQHITETRSDKLSDSLHFAILLRLIQTLHINFADTLGAPHHIGGIHRLIRGNHDEFLRPVQSGRLCGLPGAEYIIFIASLGLTSMRGTCLWAAAWYTISGL